MLFQNQNQDVQKDKDLTLLLDGEGMTLRTIVQSTYTRAQYILMDSLDGTSGTHSVLNEQHKQIGSTVACIGQKEAIVCTKRVTVLLGSNKATYSGTMKTAETPTAKREFFQMDGMIRTHSSGSVVAMTAAHGIPLRFPLQLLSICSAMVVAAKKCLE